MGGKLIYILAFACLASLLVGCSQPALGTSAALTEVATAAPHEPQRTPIQTSSPTALPTAPPPTVTPYATLLPGPSPTVAPTKSPDQAVLVSENLSAGDPYAPELGNRGYDVRRYTLALTLDPGSAFIQGRAAIEAASTSDGLRQVSLDFIGFEIQEVSLDGASLDAFREAGKLVVNLPAAIDSGSSFNLEIAYSGEPTREPSIYVPFIPYLGLQYPETNDSLFVVAEPDGARYWFPCNDHPRDKAAYRFELTVPQDLVGVANGALIETQTGIPEAFPDHRPGDLYIWEHNYPMASAFVTVAVGDYRRVESVSPNSVLLRHYIFPQEQGSFQAAQPMIGEMIDWMSELLGPYPFEAFGYLSVSDFGASLETQTMVVLSENGIEDQAKLAHEMAHMWFGDWVSLDSWGEMWRSEGFATYIQDMWMTRGDPAELESQIDRYKAVITDDPRNFPLNTPSQAELFGRDSYLKGAVLIHELRREIGDQAFFDGLRLYFERYGGGAASDAQFQVVMEEASGIALDDLFEYWFE